MHGLQIKTPCQSRIVLSDIAIDLSSELMVYLQNVDGTLVEHCRSWWGVPVGIGPNVNVCELGLEVLRSNVHEGICYSWGASERLSLNLSLTTRCLG